MNVQEALEIADNVVVEFINPAEQEALMALATAYREAMTLRPMESAPDEPVLIKFYSGNFVQHNGRRRRHNVYAAGWLPLPTPINEGG